MLADRLKTLVPSATLAMNAGPARCGRRAWT